MYMELGITPASVALAQARLCTLARFACLDKNHPVSRRIGERLPTRIPLTMLQCRATLVGKTMKPLLFAKNNGFVLLGVDFCGRPKIDAAKRHLEMLDRLPLYVAT
ncbi:hypothetical protein GGI43DRAFT_416870 [Trichoderma evansii]